MRDYEELVERLRTGTYTVEELSIILPQAADAIEELCDGAKLYKEAYINEHDERIEEIKRHKWISVEERLPESGTHVLACCRVKWLGGGGRSYVCDAFHSDSKTIPCSYNDDIDMEYDEETDEYYFPEGWWEVIKNWGEYSCVAIADSVTHWMPLPEPPKEDDNA